MSTHLYDSGAEHRMRAHSASFHADVAGAEAITVLRAELENGERVFRP